MLPCRACGFIHSPMIGCERAKRIATNKEANATNAVRANERMADSAGLVRCSARSGNQDEHENRIERSPVAVARSPKRKLGVGAKTKNRRAREAYNAYQKELMRKRRLAEKTKPA